MRRWLAAICVVFLLAGTPRTARAQADFGEAVGLVFLFTFDILATIGGSVTGIGSSVQLSRDPPGLGWSIASIVIGGLAALIGGITVAALIASDETDTPGFWVFAGVPLAISALNLSIGIVNVLRWGNAKETAPEEEEYEEVEQDEWTRVMAPGQAKRAAPGVGLSISW